jgi:branched-subunit amino acid transport protein
VHLYLRPELYFAWWGYRLFFLSVAVFQALCAAALLGFRTRAPDPALLLRGAIANAGIVAFYIVTRTAGIPPIGPSGGLVEPVGVPEVVAKVLETAVVGLLTAQLVKEWRGRRPASLGWKSRRTGPGPGFTSQH